MKQAAQSPVVEPGALSARTRAEELLLADTGATHELDSVKPGIIPDTNARRVKLHVATGKEDAWITEEEVVYVESEDRLQRLFPIGVYVTECDLQWVWQGPQCKLVLPGGAEIGLIVKGRCIYIRESDAATLRKLRKELRERNLAISMKWAHVYTVTVQQLRQHQLLGHPSFLKECRDCRLAAGRMRVHRRMDPSLRPGGELSLDVSGHTAQQYGQARSQRTQPKEHATSFWRHTRCLRQPSWKSGFVSTKRHERRRVWTPVLRWT